MHSICNLKYNVPKKIPIAFYNTSNRLSFYHKIAAEFEKQFTCLAENTEKCIAFVVPIEE